MVENQQMAAAEFAPRSLWLQVPYLLLINIKKADCGEEDKKGCEVNEYNQSTLYICIKYHYETYYFVQLMHTNLKKRTKHVSWGAHTANATLWMGAFPFSVDTCWELSQVLWFISCDGKNSQID
jgi:hypothetical protein